MGVLGLSQPLVSRNLSLLQKAGFLDDRREGKMTFYAVKKSPGKIQDRLIGILSDSLRGNAVLSNDIKSLGECREFQKKTGKCGMETYLAYMEEKKKRGGRSKA